MDGATRGGKIIKLKEIANQAMDNCPNLTHCFVTGRLGKISETNSLRPGSIDIDLDEAILNSSSKCDHVWVNSENPLYYLYTSKSTGKPKGLT